MNSEVLYDSFTVIEILSHSLEIRYENGSGLVGDMYNQMVKSSSRGYIKGNSLFPKGKVGYFEEDKTVRIRLNPNE